MAEAIGQSDPIAAERELLARATAAQHEMVRDCASTGGHTADDQAARTAILALTPMISVRANVRAGAPSPGSSPPPATGASAERAKSVKKYRKQCGFKRHPAYTPAN